MKTIFISIPIYIGLILGSQTCGVDCSGNQPKYYEVRIIKKGNARVKHYFTRVSGIGNGNPIQAYNDDSLSESYSLCLNNNSNITQFVFENSGRIDTLTFTYQHDRYFKGNECGYVDEIHHVEVSSNSLVKSGYYGYIDDYKNIDLQVK